MADRQIAADQATEGAQRGSENDCFDEQPGVARDPADEVHADRDSPKKARWIVKASKPVVLAMVVLLAAGLGFRFKSLARPAEENAKLAVRAPQHIDVYVSNPKVSVSLIAKFALDPYSPRPEVVEGLYLNVTAPAPLSNAIILITSDIRDVRYEPPYAVQPLPHMFNSMRTYISSLTGSGSYSRSSNIYVKQITVKAATQGIVQETKSGIAGLFIGEFRLPNAIQQTNGSLFVHLPSLAADWLPHYSFPAYLAEAQRGVGPISDLIDDPQLKRRYSRPSYYGGYVLSRHAPSDYQTRNGSPGEFLWNPRKLFTLEAIRNASDELLPNRNINALPAGALNGSDYVWQATGPLEATLVAVNPASIDSQNNFAFLSGIMLGLGGAAAIALIQELPDAMSLPMRRPNWLRRPQGVKRDGKRPRRAPHDPDL